jgi:hypothetical protein
MRLPPKKGNRYEYSDWYINSIKIESAKMKNIVTMERELSSIYRRLLSNPKFLEYVEFLKKRHNARGGSAVYKNIARKMQAGQTGNYGINENLMKKTCKFLQTYFKNYKH